LETNQMNNSVSHSVVVDAPQERAFYAFAQQMTSWWPRQYTWSGEHLGHIVLEPEAGARWYEKGGNGEEHPDWGKLLVWEPGERLVLSWQIGTDRQPETDPSHASEVEVRFSENDGGTRVDLEHRGLSHHGDSWQSYRDGMAGPDGWSKILGSYAGYVGQQNKQYGAAEERLAS
jgi:uncharacterized protein YndB with AHSA1/START domain